MQQPYPFAYLVYPETQSALLIGVALLLLGFRRYRIATSIAFFAMAWVALCSTPAFVNWLRAGLVSAYIMRSPAEYPIADAIVVLGGGDPPWYVAGPENERGNRTRFALDLYRAGRAPVILLSGGAGEAREMAKYLEQEGVPASAMRIESDSVTTRDNAVLSNAILEREQRRRILLVTSIVPMRRAAGAFERQGLSVVAAPVIDANQGPLSASAAWWPQREVLGRSRRYLHEYLGMTFYRLGLNT